MFIIINYKLVLLLFYFYYYYYYYYLIGARITHLGKKIRKLNSTVYNTILDCVYSDIPERKFKLRIWDTIKLWTKFKYYKVFALILYNMGVLKLSNNKSADSDSSKGIVNDTTSTSSSNGSSSIVMKHANCGSASIVTNNNLITVFHIQSLRMKIWEYFYKPLSFDEIKTLITEHD